MWSLGVSRICKKKLEWDVSINEDFWIPSLCPVSSMLVSEQCTDLGKGGCTLRLFTLLVLAVRTVHLLMQM